MILCNDQHINYVLLYVEDIGIECDGTSWEHYMTIETSNHACLYLQITDEHYLECYCSMFQ